MFDTQVEMWCYEEEVSSLSRLVTGFRRAEVQECGVLVSFLSLRVAS